MLLTAEELASVYGMRHAAEAEVYQPARFSCFCAPVTRNDQPAWYPPANADSTGLRVHNSLTKSKEPFIPMEERLVRWYVCGPTVYDVAHLGHARAYLTFDILRRIMEDYFNFEVIYQMNVTDIDDKIILRARRTKLLDDYKKEGRVFEDVLKDVGEACAAFGAKMDAKLADLRGPPPPNLSDVERDERTELLRAQELKHSQWQATQAKVAEATAAMDARALIEAAAEPLQDTLDTAKGATVTDAAVFEAHARHYEREFLDDMAALGVRPATVMTRVTEYVPQVVAFIERLVGKGLAYESSGSVYMDIAAFKSAGHDYRKLVPAHGADTTDAQMNEGEGALCAGDGEKRSRNDFALWKASKAGEPSWPSPWGTAGGRPGWHVECSVMASEVLGANMDVHAGGSDLKFPHHDNELAQSEAFHGCHQWVNYFLHAGHLNIAGQKMSKSLKNFITIREALKEFTPRQLRLMFLAQPWDRAMQYSDQTGNEAKTHEKKLKDFFGMVKALRRDAWQDRPLAHTPLDAALAAQTVAFRKAAHEALLDNFNTPAVLQGILALAGQAQDYARQATAQRGAPNFLAVHAAAVAITRYLRVFGVAEAEDFGLPLRPGGGDGEGGGSREAIVEPFADALVRTRDSLRRFAMTARDGRPDPALLAFCDEVRDKHLAALGVRVEDSVCDGGNSMWRMDDPATLKREVQEKLERAARAATEKARNKLKERTKELEKLVAASLPPTQLFRERFVGKYSQFDERGVPTATVDGMPLTKSAAKSVEKDFAKHIKEHEALNARLKDKPMYLDELRAEIAQLQAASLS